MNSTFQSFVHSEVKTSKGFRLVEAYLTYKDKVGDSSENFFENDVVNGGSQADSRKKVSFTAEPEFTSTTLFEDMPGSWVQSSHSGTLNNPPVPHEYQETEQPYLKNRVSAYRVLSEFKPKGQSLDFRF